VPEKLEEHSIMLLNWAKVSTIVLPYLAFHPPSSLSLSHTSFVPLQRTTSPVSGVSRVRALQVLLALAPPTKIEAISGTTIADIR
jgi:hypothetical protein